MHPNIHIGTSGWSYKHWKGNFYPQGLKTEDWLPYYAQKFLAAEINNSFYRLPSVETVQAWADAVPPQFLFCPKMSRFLTHMKKLREPEEPLERFFTVFEPLKNKMGPVLLQLPPQLPFRYDIAEYCFSQMRIRYGSYSFVVEARHPSWLHDDALTLMAACGIGWVLAQSGTSFPYAEVITAQTVYIRFHGPAQLYASAYSDGQLQMFAEKCNRWAAEGHTVWAFFNNDIHGYAPNDAVRLCKYVSGQRV